MSPRRIDRRDLSRLYGMDPVPDYIYEAIMRADNGKATKSDLAILEYYIEEKKKEIRERKMELGIEGAGIRSGLGRAAENVMVNVFEGLKKDEESDND